MRFRPISKKLISKWDFYEWDTKKLKDFCADFHVIGYLDNLCVGNLTYFLRLLQEGVSAKKPKGYLDDIDERDPWRRVFDHSSLWKLENGQVICTSMPYSTHEITTDDFARMAEEYSFPASIRLKFLDEKYKYRPNGSFMLMIYDEDY